MKKLILLIFLSFTVFSCIKEKSKINNQTRIKNDIPEEMMGKWKIIFEEGGGWNLDKDMYETYSDPFDTGKEYDLWIKEYSTCCINKEEGCDQESYHNGVIIDGSEGGFSTVACDSSYSINYFYTFTTKEQDIVLIGENNGEGFSGYKYQKVE